MMALLQAAAGAHLDDSNQTPEFLTARIYREKIYSVFLDIEDQIGHGHRVNFAG